MELLRAAEIRQTIGPASAGPAARPQFVITPLLAFKLVTACIFGLLTMHYLHAGKQEKSLEKLLLGGVFGLLTALVFGL